MTPQAEGTSRGALRAHQSPSGRRGLPSLALEGVLCMEPGQVLGRFEAREALVGPGARDGWPEGGLSGPWGGGRVLVGLGARPQVMLELPGQQPPRADGPQGSRGMALLLEMGWAAGLPEDARAWQAGASSPASTSGQCGRDTTLAWEGTASPLLPSLLSTEGAGAQKGQRWPEGPQSWAETLFLLRLRGLPQGSRHPWTPGLGPRHRAGWGGGRDGACHGQLCSQ